MRNIRIEASKDHFGDLLVNVFEKSRGHSASAFFSKELTEKDAQIADLNAQIADLTTQISEIKNTIEYLRDTLGFLPDGPQVQQAAERFSSSAKNIQTTRE